MFPVLASPPAAGCGQFGQTQVSWQLERPHLGLHKVISNLLCLLDSLIISKYRFENMMTYPFPSFEVYNIHVHDKHVFVCLDLRHSHLTNLKLQ